MGSVVAHFTIVSLKMITTNTRCAKNIRMWAATEQLLRMEEHLVRGEFPI